MEYSLEKMHEPKLYNERGNGKTVDAIIDAIGKLMVTDHQIIPFIVRRLDWVKHIAPMFYNLCVYHFKEKPIRRKQFELGIEGYSSRIVIFSIEQWERNGQSYSIEPTYDI